MKGDWKHSRDFYCETCGIKEPMTIAAMKAHLESAHGLTGRLAGKRGLVMALDGEGFYQNNYEWNFPGDVKITEVSSGEREKNEKLADDQADLFPKS